MRHMYLHDPEKANKSDYEVYEDEEDEGEEMEIVDTTSLQVADAGQSISIITDEDGQIHEGTIAFALNEQDEKMGEEVLVYLHYPDADEAINGDTIVVQPTPQRVVRSKKKGRTGKFFKWFIFIIICN